MTRMRTLLTLNEVGFPLFHVPTVILTKFIGYATTLHPSKTFESSRDYTRTDENDPGGEVFTHATPGHVDDGAFSQNMVMKMSNPLLTYSKVQRPSSGMTSRMSCSFTRSRTVSQTASSVLRARKARTAKSLKIPKNTTSTLNTMRLRFPTKMTRSIPPRRRSQCSPHARNCRLLRPSPRRPYEVGQPIVQNEVLMTITWKMARTT